MVSNDQVGEELYKLFADLLSFPQEEDVEGRLDRCIELLKAGPEYPETAARELENFKNSISKLTFDDLQGVYSYTFELTADYTQDLGHYLLDGFKRTNTLVAIKEMFKAQGFPYDSVSKGELPDNLVVLLRFMASLKDQALKKEFRESFFIKALEKMSKNFEQKKGKQHTEYSALVKALLIVIDTDVKNA